MKTVSSDALEALNRALGLSGSSGAQQTMLEDGTLTQVLEVSRIVSAGRSPIPGRHPRMAVLENVHAAANSQVTAVDPYFITTTPADNPFWPVPVPVGFDVWIFGSAAAQLSGGAVFKDGYFGLVDNIGESAFSLSGAASAVSTTVLRSPLNIWNYISSPGSTTFSTLLHSVEDPQSWRPHMLRIPRGMTIEFRTDTSGIGTFDCFILMGIYPTGMPPDAAS